MRRLLSSLVFSLLVPISSSVWAQGNVLTQHNDNNRTGANLSEALLNTSNVRPGQFGKLFSRAVDGQVYAQPLYVSNLAFPDGVAHNVIYLATMNNSVYAYDADDPAQSEPLWKVNLGPASVTPNADFACVPDQCPYGPYHDIFPQLGISGTPVIDLAARALYAVTFTNELGIYHQRLHALDIVTGQEMLGGPVEISGAVFGTGDASVDGVIFFDPMQHMERAGLLLSNGVLYIAFASHADFNPYHGWVFAYDAATLQQLGVHCTTPDAGAGGIWQSNQGLVADPEGYVYLMTGNKRLQTPDAVLPNYGEAFLKLQLTKNGGLTVVDYFIPCNQCCLDRTDADLGSAGPLLIPGFALLGAGKQGRAYLLNPSNMGGYQKGQTPTCATSECNSCVDDQPVQRFQVTSGSTNSSPIFWDGPGGPMIYIWGNNDAVKAYQLVGGLFQTTPTSASSVTGPWGGGNLSLSANGKTPGTGIVWGTRPLGSSNPITQMGELYAFDASNLAANGGNGIWSSNRNETFDGLGTLAKYNMPTIANGKVYAASASGQVHVYGLLPKNPPPLVRLTAPTTRSTIVGPADITVRATALSRDDSLGIAVDFYADDTLIGSADSPPYQVVWQNAPFGHHRLVAVATDTIGATARSGAVEIDVVSQPPQIARIISIKFVGPGNPMDPEEVAGVVPWFNWNNAKSEDPGHRTKEGWFNTLVDDLGMITGASMSWTASNVGFLLIPDTPGDFRMMRAYLETTNTTSTHVTVYNLPGPFTKNGYDVYVYFDGDNSQSITSTFRIGSTVVNGTDAAGTDFSGQFIEAIAGSEGNYVVIPGLTEDRFTLEAKLPARGATAQIKTPVNSIQIVARTVQP